MKTLTITALFAGFCLTAAAQSPAPTVEPPSVALNIKLPTYIVAGGAWNQYAVQRANLFVSAIAPVANKLGVYESTTADIHPIKETDGLGRTVYVFQASVRQGLHKVVYTSTKVTVLAGGDIGASFSQAGSGIGASLTGSVTITPLFHISQSWSIAVPVRGLWIPSAGWGIVPEIGIVWRP